MRARRTDWRAAARIRGHCRTYVRSVSSELFEDIRQRLKVEAKREDVVILVAWLLTHFTDDGHLRSPQAARRKTIVLDGLGYWLVRCPASAAKPPPEP